MSSQTWFLAVTAFVFGTVVGSFLNVVIYRLPRNLSVVYPEHSFCPNCSRRLGALDLVPLFSFLLLGRKCRGCKQPISWRYFNVELLTGVLWASLYLRFSGSAADAVAMMLFTAVLIPIYFIDFATFTIPNSLTVLAYVIAVGRDAWGIAQHEVGHDLLFGWLPRSIVAGMIGALVFGLTRVAGSLWKRVEAMGLGDPVLARAMAAMLISIVPVGAQWFRLIPIWVVLSVTSGALVGGFLIYYRTWREARSASANKRDSEADSAGIHEDSAGEKPNLAEQILDIGQMLVLWDIVLDLRYWIVTARQTDKKPPEGDEVVDLGPIEPTAIPFGPFLVLGFLGAAFIGEWLTAAYIAFAFPKG